MTAWYIDERFSIPANASVLAFIRDRELSAHSDVAEELTRSGSGLSSVHTWCPDPPRYAFVVLHLEDGTIIGLAYGMSGLAFRLPEHRVEEALCEGGIKAEEIGPGWIRFEPWTPEETLAQSHERLGRWCAVAADRSET